MGPAAAVPAKSSRPSTASSRSFWSPSVRGGVVSTSRPYDWSRVNRTWQSRLQ